MDRDEFLKDLYRVSGDIALIEAQLKDLLEMRDDMILTGKKEGIPTTELGRAAGIRRESAHYAAQRAEKRRADVHG